MPFIILLRKLPGEVRKNLPEREEFSEQRRKSGGCVTDIDLLTDGEIEKTAPARQGQIATIASRRIEFQKRSQLLIGAHKRNAPSVVAMGVTNSDRSLT